MGEWDPQGRFPKTAIEAYRQGKADRRAGYPVTWTPNLGPLSRDRACWEWWRAGWYGDPSPDEVGVYAE